MTFMTAALAVSGPLSAAENSIEPYMQPNRPIGTPHGIHPGRVAWAHFPGAATWNGTDGYWWEEQYAPQARSTAMMQQAIRTVAGKKTEKAAWQAIFRNFNQEKGRGRKGYQAPEKIAVKVNTNNTFSYDDTNDLNASPQMVLALLRSLVEEAGVPQACITVFDASRYMPDFIYNPCHAAYPEVVFMDHIGDKGRVKATFVENAIPYSADNGNLNKNLAKVVVEADYLIDMCLLKGHAGQGVTLNGKNLYGATGIDPNWRKNFHNNFDPDAEGRPRYMTFTDFLGHKDLGGKTLLFIIDGLYGSLDVNGAPKPKWQMAPFNNDWACSLFVSQDGVACDAVGIDFLRSEWPDLPDGKYAEQYLIEAALAGNPPSGTVYDPERDGTALGSLGVMEHWNNASDKQYSRNLGRKEGIELVYVKVSE